MSEKKWKKFEKLVFEIQKNLAPQAEVALDDHIVGIDSKANRQIDISLKQYIGQYKMTVVIDCKDYSKPIDVNDVGQFASVVRDVRANRGVLVSANGFTTAAIESAKSQGIETYRLIDTQSIDWGVRASVPTLLARNYLKAFSLRLSGISVRPFTIPADLRGMKIYDKDDLFLGSIENILAKKWNKQEILHEPGSEEVFIGNDLILEVGTEKIKSRLDVIVIKSREYYFGKLPVNLQGFQDVQTGGVFTRQIITDRIEPYRIEQGLEKDWQKLQDVNSLAVEPVFSISISDVIPESDNFTE